MTEQEKTRMVKEAVDFLFEVYDCLPAKIADITVDDIWWKDNSRSWFCAKPRQDKYHIVIGAPREYWITYRRKTIGLWASDIPCAFYESTVLILVHELTHYVQFFRPKDTRVMGEVETTRNEIEFARTRLWHLYDQLIPTND